MLCLLHLQKHLFGLAVAYSFRDCLQICNKYFPSGLAIAESKESFVLLMRRIGMMMMMMRKKQVFQQYLQRQAQLFNLLRYLKQTKHIIHIYIMYTLLLLFYSGTAHTQIPVN